ncbi:MAG: hypothetical protein ABL921_25825 [Pirellula sp.]
MVLLHRLLGLVPLLVICGLIGQLEQRFSLGVGTTIYAVVALLATLVGTLLLRSSVVGQSSWRNILASKLLPCSGIFGYGSLLKLCLSNLLGTMLLGLVGFFIARYLRLNDYTLGRIGGWKIACGLTWIVLIWMILFLVRQYGKKYYTGPSGLRKFLKLISLPVIALAVSIALIVAGLPLVALLVAMTPFAIMFVSMGPLFYIIIFAKLSGKPFRWN